MARTQLLACFLVSLAPALPAHAGLPVRASGVVLQWSEPSCFAYSKRERAYACLHSSVGADDGVAGLQDFERLRPAPDTAWHGDKAVVLVGDTLEEIAISHKEYGIDTKVERTRSRRAAVQLAVRRGYRIPVSSSRGLPPARWVRVRGAWLRFDTRMHEGDASFENHGSLRVSCTEPTSDEAGVAIVEDNGAEQARVFAAPRTRAVVVGFVEADGGEGAAYYDTSYIRVDLATLCGAPEIKAALRG